MIKKLTVAKGESGEPSALDEILVIARTDARAVEGLDGAIQRALLYARAGADMIFPEALETREEFAEFRKKVKLPLLANMTEFGKTPYLTAAEFEELGYDVVIFPVTAFRAMMKAVRMTLEELREKGTQRNILGSLMTRDEFYKLIDYKSYEELDKKATDSVRRLRKRVVMKA
jgi:methylisocitrate lyase